MCQLGPRSKCADIIDKRGSYRRDERGPFQHVQSDQSTGFSKIGICIEIETRTKNVNKRLLSKTIFSKCRLMWKMAFFGPIFLVTLPLSGFLILDLNS